MFFSYRIDGVVAVGPPWWRSLVSRAPTGVLLKTGKTFPASHPTTKMCIRLMLRELRERRSRTLVDVGCGSGVLALAGLKLGVERAVAIDISPDALVTSRANAALNHLTNRLLLVRGSAEAVAGPFDLVLANLPAVVLRDILAQLVRMSGDDTTLVMSGFQDVDHVWVERALAEVGFSAEQWVRADLTFSALPPSGSFTWMAVLARRRDTRRRPGVSGESGLLCSRGGRGHSPIAEHLEGPADP